MRRWALVVIFFFLLLWLVGIATGEVGDILKRATSICLECMGIG